MHRPARQRAGHPDAGALETASPLNPAGDRGTSAKKTLTAAVAALTLAGAALTTTSQAQAGGLGRTVAGVVIGAAALGAVARAAEEQDYRPAYHPMRGGYEGGCGFRNSPICDKYGNRIGARRVPAC